MANASKKLHLSRKADIPLQAARLSAVSLTPHATPHLSGTKQLVATSGCICVCWLNQSFRSLHMIVAKMIFTKELTEFFFGHQKICWPTSAKHMKEMVLRLIFCQKKRTTRRGNHFPFWKLIRTVYSKKLTKPFLICESKPSETKIIHLQQFHWASHVPASFVPKSWITHVPTSFVPKSGLSLTHIPVSFAPKSCITHVSAGFAPKKRTVLRILPPTTCQIKVALRFIMRA